MTAWKLVFTSLCLLTFSISSQAKWGFFPTKFATPLQTATSNPTLQYYGGPVLSHVKVHLVFWGGVNPQTVSTMPGFYTALTNSTMMDWLDQYNTFGNSLTTHDGTKQHIGRGQYTGATQIKPFNNNSYLDDSEIQVEITKQIQAGNLPQPDDDTLYMIYFPLNYNISAFGSTSCQQFCAYHSSSGTPSTYHFFYGIMPDINTTGCDMGCAYGMDFISSSTAISSHEFTEATTDPFPAPGNTVVWPQAWNANDGSEIGDLCAGGNDVLKVGSDSYTVQSEFDNSKNKCSNNTWTSP